jgi:hypothetical protein
MDRSLGRLKTMIDSLVELHGESAEAIFLHQVSFRGKQRTRRAMMTAYRVSQGGISRPTVIFELDYPRGDLVTEQEIVEAQKDG